MIQCHGRPISMFCWKERENYLESNDDSVSWWKGMYSWEKNIYQNNAKIEFIYNQTPKKFIESLGKIQVTGKKNILPSPPNHLRSSWPAAPLCHPTIVLCIGQYLLCMSGCSPQPLSCVLDNIFYLWVPVHFHIRKISRSHGFFGVQWNFRCQMESFKYWILYVSKNGQYYTTYKVMIVTQFPYIVR